MAGMDSSLMPDPASGDTSPDLGQPSPGEHGGLPGGTLPEPTPDPAAPQPWPPYPPAATGWGTPPAPLPAWPQAAWGPPAPPPRHRAVGFAFGGALIAGGLIGALVMAAVGNATGHPATSSTVVPSQQQQLPSQADPFFGGGGFSGQNPSSGGAGSSGSSGSGSSSLDANAIAAKVDPAIVDITSSLGGNGTAAGTGMVITPGGQVLTNHHVIQGATYIGVQIAGTGKTYPATVIGSDPANDVALLQIQGVSNLQTITVGDASKVAKGDPIIAIGNALGRGGAPAVAAGTVTALQQTITATDDTGANAETLTNLIQVDANVLPGDSGGPLVDASGKVIGMDTAASSSGRGFRFRGVSAQGFAIPIGTAMSVVQQLRNSGAAPQTAAQTALLGVDIADASSQGTTGALVMGVQPGTPAESAGIAAGDVIVTFGGKSITSPSTLSTAVKAHKPGDRVSVAWVDQGGQSHNTTLQLAGLSAPAA
jgi:S1-C subfamily serine protease